MPDKKTQAAPDVLPADSELFDDMKPTTGADAPTQTINTPGQMLSATGSMIGDIGKGALKGALHTISSSDQFARDHLPARLTNQYLGFGKPADLQNVQRMATPNNTAQKIGYGGEQVGEFLAPAGLEKALVGKAAEFAPKAAPLARVLTGALSSGAVNKAQGGSFTGGAVTGGATGAVGEGMRALAPSLMKNALRVGSEGLEYDRNTGKSVLEHTRGIRPGTIAKQAQEKVGDWSRELDTMAANSPDADMTPIRAAHDTRIAEANYGNSPTEQKLLDRLKQPLHFEFQNGENTGVPLPTDMPPHRLRAIKQGVGSEVGNFSPQNQALGAEYKKAIYGDIDKEFNRVVPGSAELDQRMSSLIPAIRAGQKVENAAPISQRVMHRIAAHTGAAAGMLAGGYSGLQHGGIPGMIAGGVGGLVIPEVMVSPRAQALGARVLNSPVSGRIMRSVATPATRETLDWIRRQNTGTGGQGQ